MLYRVNKDYFSIMLKVKAASKLESIEGFIDIAGDHYLKISTKSVPENDKANKAILKSLSKTWKIPSANLEIISGLSSSNKILSIKNITEEALKEIFAPYINNN